MVGRPARAARGPAARGFTIVEFMIVLAALGLLMGAALVPLASRDAASDRAAEEAALGRLRAAVIEFAAHNRTRARAVVVDNRPAGAGAPLWEAAIPPGRPYLPCPDLDGDGREDRLLPAPAPATVTLSAAGGYRELYAAGACRSNIGLLPWRTIGVEATDTWGNLYAYRVHDSFANSAVGFDHLTRADAYDESSPLEQHFFTIPYTEPSTLSAAPTQYVASGPLTSQSPPAQRVALTIHNRLDLVAWEGTLAVDPENPPTLTATVGTMTATMVLNRYPLVVCSPAAATPSVNIDPLCERDGVAGELAPLEGGASELAVEFDPPRAGPAGPLVARVYRRPADADDDPAGAITDGAAFGIVSFGRNGRGAPKIDEWIGTSSVPGSVLDCDNIYHGGRVPSHPEIIHAHWLLDVDWGGVSPICGFASSTARTEAYARRMMFWMPPAGVRSYHVGPFFGVGSVSTGDAEYDDVTAWAGPNELVGKLARQGVLPVPPMPYLGLPDPPPAILPPGLPATVGAAPPVTMTSTMGMTMTMTMGMTMTMTMTVTLGPPPPPMTTTITFTHPGLGNTVDLSFSLPAVSYGTVSVTIRNADIDPPEGGRDGLNALLGFCPGIRDEADFPFTPGPGLTPWADRWDQYEDFVNGLGNSCTGEVNGPLDIEFSGVLARGTTGFFVIDIGNQRWVFVSDP